MADDYQVRFYTVPENEFQALRAERDCYREALVEISEMTCTCTGYYRCCGCEMAGPRRADEALAAAPQQKEGQ